MPHTAIQIQRATAQHIPAIVDLAEKWTLSQLPLETAQEKGFLVSNFTQEKYLRFLSYVDHFYVLYYQGELAAFLLAYSSRFIQPDEWLNLQIRQRHPNPFVLIKQIAVHPEHQGKGLASKMYTYLFQQTSGLPLFTAIVVDPPNKRSIAFHERLGFRKVFEAVPPDGLRRGVWKREAEPKG